MSAESPTAAEREREEDARRLRAEWLQFRARLHDPDSGLPTLAGVVDDLRRQLEEGSPVGIFTLSLHVEQQLEESWGWQAYDRLVVEFVRALRADRGGGRVPEGILCLPAVRSDEVFLTSTSLCICPVTKVNGVAIGPKDQVWGPVTHRIADAYQRYVGHDFVAQYLRRYTDGMQARAF